MATFMKIIIILIPLLLVSACLVANASDISWRELDRKHTVLMSLPQGKVVIELAPQFSPNHVIQFEKLAKDGFYNSTSFYRVIDGFVAQAGPKDGGEKDKSVTQLKVEDQWSTDETFSFTKVQDNDLFAEQTGFKEGFAIGHSPKENTAWLTHCPGTLAMARQTPADTATSHFYFVIGQAPRYLDRLMTVFGRVVFGMEHIQSIKRTSTIEGELAVNSKEHTKIMSMQLMTDVPKDQQIIIEVENTEDKNFAKMLEARRARENKFFYNKPPPVLDVCQVPVKSRLVTN